MSESESGNDWKVKLKFIAIAVVVMVCLSIVTSFITFKTLVPALSTPVFTATPVFVTATDTPIIIPTDTPTFLPTPTQPVSTATAIPSFTPTLDYVKLGSYYLTPFPTITPRTDIPTWTPTPNINPLSEVSARGLPDNWTPTPPPLVDFSPAWIWAPAYIQAATDVMNFTNGDQKLFLQYVESWTPQDRPSMVGSAWLLKDDFDHDGQPEWLASIPVYFLDRGTPCCSQVILFFEKIGNTYQPMHFDHYGYYDWISEHNEITKAVLVDDLNNDGFKEIVFRTVSCGTACTQYLSIGMWNGKKWTDYQRISTVQTYDNQISFIDLDDNGTTEIIIDYSTQYKLDSSYPMRRATDIYEWKNGQFVLVDELRQPSTNPYAIMRDVYSALAFGKIDEALRLAQPTLDNLDQTCSPMETYTGIEVMMAYAVQNDPNAMQSTLSKIAAGCNQPDNGFTPAANILWQAYQQVHDPVVACQAMKRFISDEDHRKFVTGIGFQFFDAGILIPHNYNFCPIEPYYGS